MNDPNQPAAIVTEIKGAIAVVRFNRPAERNTLAGFVLDQLDQTLRDLNAKENIAAIIFTGTGDVFLSGADIRELARLDQTTARTFSQRGQQVMQRIADVKPRTIAAINGYCMGGGLDLALACDERIASASAVFAHPGAQLGIMTGWGGTQRLPRLIGEARALELFFTARRIDSREALEFGLISEICDPVLDGAFRLATTS